MARWSGSPRPAEETGGAWVPLVGLGPTRRCKPGSSFRGEGSWCDTWPPEEGARIRVPPAAGGGGADLGLLGGLSWGRGSESPAARARGHGPVSPANPGAWVGARVPPTPAGSAGGADLSPPAARGGGADLGPPGGWGRGRGPASLSPAPRGQCGVWKEQP